MNLHSKEQIKNQKALKKLLSRLFNPKEFKLSPAQNIVGKHQVFQSFLFEYKNINKKMSVDIFFYQKYHRPDEKAKFYQNIDTQILYSSPKLIKERRNIINLLKEYEIIKKNYHQKIFYRQTDDKFYLKINFTHRELFHDYEVSLEQTIIDKFLNNITCSFECRNNEFIVKTTTTKRRSFTKLNADNVLEWRTLCVESNIFQNNEIFNEIKSLNQHPLYQLNNKMEKFAKIDDIIPPNIEDLIIFIQTKSKVIQKKQKILKEVESYINGEQEHFLSKNYKMSKALYEEEIKVLKEAIANLHEEYERITDLSFINK